MARRNPDMITDYRQDLRLFKTRGMQVGMLALALLWLWLPMQADDVWLGILNGVAIIAIGGIGLNLLSGYTGQISLGHAFFMAMGAFTAAFLSSKGVPMLGWLVVAALVSALVGALIGPVALRLEGNYLAIVTVGLLFVGEHLFLQMSSITGGSRGMAASTGLDLGPLDFYDLHLFGVTYTKEQGVFFLLWAVLALCALLAKNIVRTRPGRAMQAIRDRDIAAEVVGISLLRYKVGAFAVSSALAGVAGAFYVMASVRYVNPEQFGGVAGLLLSIQFVAVIIIGGMGTIYGAILGALMIGVLPHLIELTSGFLPFLKTTPTDEGLITVASFNNALFGVLVIVFLLAEPLGLAGIWMRAKAYFKSWPFSY
jgi:branched-chain amino acid transport system permease protein